MSNFQREAAAKDFPVALVLDYLEVADEPTIEGLEEYREEQDSSYNAQVRWDASQNPLHTTAGLL